MNAYEKICVDVVGQFYTLPNLRVGIAIPRHHNFHVGKAFGDVVAQ